MLPKENRIKKRKEFQKVLISSKTYKTPFFILRINKNNLNKNRFAFVVGRKVSPKATVRNKIKRRLAAIIRGEKEKIKLGTDMVIIALPGIEKINFTEIKKTIEKEFKKINLCLNP